MDEQALFLSRMEFAALLLAENITEIVCFPMPKREETEEKQMIEAVYELVSMGCLQVHGTSVRWSDFIKSRMEPVRDAKKCLLMEPGDSSLPQKICYIGERIAVLENVQKEGKAFRFFSMDKKDFWKWLEDSMDIPKAAAEKKEEAELLLEYHELALKEKALLRSCGRGGEIQRISEWMEQVKQVLDEIPFVGIRCIWMEKEQKEQINLMICRGILNTWFLWKQLRQDFFLEPLEDDMVHVEPDSAELRREIESMLWRKEK